MDAERDPAAGALEVRQRRGAWWEVHRRIFARWIADAAAGVPPGLGLKTDLFDEASGEHHVWQELPSGWTFIGIDIDVGVVRKARVRLAAEGRQAHCAVADVRALPFPRSSISSILSLSTLDHLGTRNDIALALREFERTLIRGGRLLLTLDNPRNPEVALRALLPRFVVQHLRADTFALGVTVSQREGTRMLRALGFQVLQTAYAEHAPRYVAIRAIAWLTQINARLAARWLARLVAACEGFRATPLAPWSGHYTVWIASAAQSLDRDSPEDAEEGEPREAATQPADAGARSTA